MAEDFSAIPTFRCVLVGEGHVGKTTFLKRHLTGEFERKYLNTLEAQAYPLIFHTTRGPIRFQMWDYCANAGRKNFRRRFQGKCQCAIIMFDVTCPLSYLSVSKWHRELFSFPLIPIVLCANKADVPIKVHNFI